MLQGSMPGYLSAQDAKIEADRKSTRESASAADKQKAVAAYKAGVEAFINKNYGAAIIRFKQGDNAYPTGDFRAALARAYAALGAGELLKGNSKGAITEYDRALGYARATELDESTRPERREANRPRIGAFTAQRARGMAMIVAKDIGTSRVNATTSLPARSSEGIGTFGWTGLTLGVLGAGTLASSLYFNGKVSDFKDGDTSITQEEAEDAQSTGRLLLGVGSAVTVIGFGMFLYALGTRSDGTAIMWQLEPREGGAYAGAALSW